MPAVSKKDVEDLKLWMDGKFSEQSVRLTGIEEKIDDHNTRLSTLEQQTSILEDGNSALQQQIQTLTDEYDQKLSMMEARLLQENLRFSNIDNHGTAEESVRHFLISSLNIDSETVKQMEMLKCYKVGKPLENGATDNRSILVKFLRSSDKQAILNAAFKKKKGTKGGVREDLPLKWAQARTDLYKKFVLPAKQSDQYVNPKIKWIGDKLELNGHKVNPTDSWNTITTYLQKE